MKGLLFALGFGIATLPACTAVLGMERAELDEGVGAGGGAGAGGSGGAISATKACKNDPVPGCTSCLETAPSCSGVFQECAGNFECRIALDDFAQCLTARCDADLESCSSRLPRNLQACLSFCPQQCARTNAVSQCELYCGCMRDCPSEQALLGDCLTTCKSWPSEVRDCRRDHCEWGHGALNHCQHASGALNVCLSSTDLPPSQRKVCTNGQESTWACDLDSDCCSGSCRDGACL